MSETNNILKAPGIWELTLALFDGDWKRRRPVEFVVEGKDFLPSKHEIKVVINSVSREDGSGQSWCFQGFVLEPWHKEIPVEGWFRTTDRKGWIKFI